MTGHKHYISIWFFIGCLLAFYGVLILGSGIYAVAHPPAQRVVLEELRPGVWWGALMTVLGLVYVVRFRPGRE